MQASDLFGFYDSNPTTIAEIDEPAAQQTYVKVSEQSPKNTDESPLGRASLAINKVYSPKKLPEGSVASSVALGDRNLKKTATMPIYLD